MPLAPAGNIRALAVSSPNVRRPRRICRRSPKPACPVFEIINWYGAGRAKTPPSVIDKLYAATLQTLQTAEVRERLLKRHRHVASTPAVFSDYIRDDIAKWIRVVKAANIRLQ